MFWLFVFGVCCLALVIADLRAGKAGDTKLRIIFTIIGIAAIAIALNFGSGSSGSSNQCGYCHRKFSDHENIMSIKKTNLCLNCYKNYQWGQKATGK